MAFMSDKESSTFGAAIGAMDSGLDPDLVQRLGSGFVVFPGRLTDGHMILVDYYLLQDMPFWIILICFIIGRFSL